MLNRVGWQQDTPIPLQTRVDCSMAWNLPILPWLMMKIHLHEPKVLKTLKAMKGTRFVCSCCSAIKHFYGVLVVVDTRKPP